MWPGGTLHVVVGTLKIGVGIPPPDYRVSLTWQLLQLPDYQLWRWHSLAWPLKSETDSTTHISVNTYPLPHLTHMHKRVWLFCCGWSHWWQCNGRMFLLMWLLYSLWCLQCAGYHWLSSVFIGLDWAVLHCGTRLWLEQGTLRPYRWSSVRLCSKPPCKYHGVLGLLSLTLILPYLL